MSDFAPVDGRGGWTATSSGLGASGVTGARSRTTPVEALPRLDDAPGASRRIADEVELSDAALAAQRPVREEIIARARERIASGFYDQRGVIEQTIDRISSGLVG